MRQGPIIKPARRIVRLWAVVLIAATASGCDLAGADSSPGRQLRDLREENARLKSQLREQQELLAARDKQILALQGLGQKRLDQLFHVTRIDLGRYTGGVDLDGQPGDEGIRVYLQPKDRQGHPIKAAGTATIQLFDLAAEPDGNLLASYKFAPEEMAKHWYSGFATYHYRFDCRWRAGTPKNPEVTVRVTFTDYLTGKQFAAQKLCQIKLLPTTRPGR